MTAAANDNAPPTQRRFNRWKRLMETMRGVDPALVAYLGREKLRGGSYEAASTAVIRQVGARARAGEL